MELTEIRKNLDRVDKQIVDLYRERMHLAELVAESKRESGRNVYDKKREDEKLRTVSGMVEEPEYRQGVQELFSQLMSTSRKLQYARLAKDAHGSLPFMPVDSLNKKARVVYQGAEGSYSEQAAHVFSMKMRISFISILSEPPCLLWMRGVPNMRCFRSRIQPQV